MRKPSTVSNVFSASAGVFAGRGFRNRFSSSSVWVRRVGSNAVCRVLRDPVVRDAAGGQAAGLADPQEDVARLLEVVEHLGLLGERPLAMRGHLLVDLRDQAVERVAVEGGLAVEVDVHRVGVRLGVGQPDGGLREGPRRDPGRAIDGQRVLELDPAADAARPQGRSARARPCR